MTIYNTLYRQLTTALGIGVFLAATGCGQGSIPESKHTNIPLELENQGPGSSVEFMRAKGKTRDIDFTTDEGTHLSVDISPDGNWLLFDLLGHIYRMPATGGDAVSLTQGSGIALNFHPAWSPDGSQIAFISDRSGQDNVWTMNADGSNVQPGFLDAHSRFTDPDWHPDGDSVVAVRITPSPGRGWHRRVMSLAGINLTDNSIASIMQGQFAHYSAPSYSSDGKHLYFQTEYSTWRGNGLLKAGHRIQRKDMQSGEVVNVRLDEPVELTEEFLASLSATGYAADVAGDNPAALNPEPSPDGRYLAFAIERPEVMMNYRGHQFQGVTGIMLRDLQNGDERLVVPEANHDLTKMNAQYSYRSITGFSWASDGSALWLSFGGKVHRVDINSGADDVIPFNARVQRTLSEQVRSDVAINDNAFKSKFLQWPTSSPDGHQLVFVSAGQLWTMALPDGDPQPLTKPMPSLVQLTPDFSPDGKQLVFASWSNSDGGHLWQVAANGGKPTRLTSEPAQYLYPSFSADGTTIVATKGASSVWPSFTSPSPGLANDGDTADTKGWQLVTLNASDGTSALVKSITKPLRGIFLDNGRISTYGQDDVVASFDLRSPFPNEAALKQVVKVDSYNNKGGDRKTHAILPPRLDFFGGSNDPLLSPDGKWLAYQAGRAVYVMPVDRNATEPQHIEINPNADVPGRIRIGDRGGLFPHWRNANTVEFVSGSKYFSYNVSSREMTSVDVNLNVPREVPKGSMAFTGARIITIDNNVVIENGDLVIDGARIRCVGECDVSGVDQTIDATGKTIIPGLVDLHAHHTGVPAGVVTQHWPMAALDLAYGVTTIVDPATASESAFPLAEMIEAGVLVGPRTYSSAEFVITQASAWGDNLEITGPENAAFNAGYRFRWGAIELKNYRLASRQQHQYLIEAAREQPITVTAEGGPLFADIGYTLDGQTGWEHIVAPLPLYKDASLFFGTAGVHYSPTVIVAGHVNGAKDYFRQSQGLLEDSKYNRFSPRDMLEQQQKNLHDWPKTEFSFPIMAEGLADIVRAGGYGALGEHGEQVGIGSHWELWAYAEALTPLEALKVASYDGAHFVGLDKEIGSIKTGKIADLIVLNSNPLENIRNSADIAFVVKAGNVYDDDTLNRVWPDNRAFGPAPWWPAD